MSNTDPTPDEIKAMIEACGGKVEEMTLLPDGHGFATASFPLPKDHWLTAAGWNEPPMPWRTGTADPKRQEMAEQIRAAAKYAIRASTYNGKETDFDPDAMVQNFVVGMLGYWTDDGTSKEGG